MAYELNLTDEQYEAAYQINLDYLMKVNNSNNIYGTYWTLRNSNLAYILADWQYTAYKGASYFYRPVYWANRVFHFSVYSRYTNRNYYYRSRPSAYASYRGGNSRGYYTSRSWNKPAAGMRNVRGNSNNRTFGNGNRINSNRNVQRSTNGNNMNRTIQRNGCVNGTDRNIRHNSNGCVNNNVNGNNGNCTRVFGNKTSNGNTSGNGKFGGNR